MCVRAPAQSHCGKAALSPRWGDAFIRGRHCGVLPMMSIGGSETIEPRMDVMIMRVVPHQPFREGWFSTPTTLEGWWAAGSASSALALGVLGEAARRGDVGGPFYPLAFVLGLLGGVAAILAVRHGERSLLAVLAFLPLLLGVGFGLAELLG